MCGQGDSNNVHRFIMLANDDHWLGLGFERELGDGEWALHGRAGVGLHSGLIAGGLRLRLAEFHFGEASVLVGGGRMGCASFSDTSPVCEIPNEGFDWAAGAAGQWLFFLSRGSLWMIGPEVGYWRTVTGQGSRGFDVWTIGVVVHRRFPQGEH